MKHDMINRDNKNMNTSMVTITTMIMFLCNIHNCKDLSSKDTEYVLLKHLTS